MGAEYRMFIGPYIRCSTRTSPRLKTIKTCTKDTCRFNSADNPMAYENNFCPQCGSPAVSQEIQVEGRVKEDVCPSWVYTEMDESICGFNQEYAEPGVHIFVPNRDGIREFTFSRSDDKVGEILRVRAVTLEQEMIWLETRFKAELERAREIYGDDKVEVRWGILGEWL